MRRWPCLIQHQFMKAIWSASVSTPAMRCAATKSDARSCSRRLCRLWRHSRHPVSRRSHSNSAARMPWSKATAMSLGQGAGRLPRGAPQADLRGRHASMRDQFLRRALGPDSSQQVICGPQCRPCAAAPNIVRSALSGAPTARNRASEPSDASSTKSSSFAAWAFALSRWPTTISILSPSPISNSPDATEQQAASRGTEGRFARSASS